MWSFENQIFYCNFLSINDADQLHLKQVTSLQNNYVYKIVGHIVSMLWTNQTEVCAAYGTTSCNGMCTIIQMSFRNTVKQVLLTK